MFTWQKELIEAVGFDLYDVRRIVQCDTRQDSLLYWRCGMVIEMWYLMPPKHMMSFDCQRYRYFRIDFYPIKDKWGGVIGFRGTPYLNGHHAIPPQPKYERPKYPQKAKYPPRIRRFRNKCSKGRWTEPLDWTIEVKEEEAIARQKYWEEYNDWYMGCFNDREVS